MQEVLQYPYIHGNFRTGLYGCGSAAPGVIRDVLYKLRLFWALESGRVLLDTLDFRTPTLTVPK